MREYYRATVAKKLREIFDEPDATTVLSWLVGNDGRRPVVVVGSGFSLNANSKRTGQTVSRNQLPLWGDVLAKFSADLGLNDASKYDALTLAEMHCEEMGHAAFYSSLLELVEDDDLAPGPAHKALHKYPAEAIITTNQLDTLLDHNEPWWRRVICDPDLALRKPRESTLDVIYFHGHRCDRSSWVFTRSEYEDIHTRKPLMVSRVRQLLSQNPVLIVGYSLNDPDFHQIYRQLSLDMASQQPLGLALFPNGRAPLPPERRHWERLGIRVAMFNGGATPEQFEKFFGISPTGGPDGDSPHGMVKWVLGTPGFAERRRRAEDILTDPLRGEPCPAQDAIDTEVWTAVLRGEFSDEEWKSLSRIHSDDEAFDESRGTPSLIARMSSPTTFRGYEVLDRRRFGVLEVFLRRVDAFLHRYELQKKSGVEAKLALARWMDFAIENRLAVVDDDFVGVLSWLWRSLCEAKPEHRRAASSSVRRCLVWARRRGQQTGHVEEDAMAVGVDPSKVTEADDRPAEYVLRMKAGFDSMMDLRYTEAAEAYQDAEAIARRLGTPFDEWAALCSRITAERTGIRIRDLAGADSEPAVETLRRHLKDVEENPSVRDWLKRRRKLAHALSNKAIEGFLRARRLEARGGSSFSWSSDPKDAWLMFREVESIHASPTLQAEYIQPLVDFGALKAQDELGYRLRLGVDRTEKASDWLSRLGDASEGTLEERRERDRAIVARFKACDKAKYERSRQLGLFAPVSPLLLVEDLDWARGMLSRAQDEFGFEIRTHSSWHNLDDDYAQAWCAYADLETREIAISQLEVFASRLDRSLRRETYARHLRRLPVEEWVGLHEDAACRIIDMALALSPQEELQAVDEHVAWILHEALAGAKRFGRKLEDSTVSRVAAWSKGVLQKGSVPRTAHHSRAFGAALHTAWMAETEAADRDGLVVKALEAANSVVGDDQRAWKRLEARLSIWVSLREAGAEPSSTAMSATAKEYWEELDGAWSDVARFARNNPYHAWPYTAFLTDLVETNAVSRRVPARKRLLDLLLQAPGELGLCSKILSPGLWDDDWGHFVRTVWRALGRRGIGDPVESMIGAIGLLGGWLHSAPVGAELPPELSFLVDSTLLAARDNRPGVANHAAYRVVALARRDHPQWLRRRLADTLEAMAADPRVTVRGAVAYACGALSGVDPGDEVRSVLAAANDAMSADPYAIIQRQLRFGELERDYPVE